MSRTNKFIARRTFVKIAGGSIAATASSLLWSSEVVAQEIYSVSPDAALDRLIAGNQRFVRQTRQNPHQSRLRLRETANNQYPFASLLTCADSRVAAEIIFDQGLGDLFVVRIAGNVASDRVLGSLEYSTAVLGSQLIVVLGHERCGAVTAAVTGESLSGKIGAFVEDIKPAVARVKNSSGDAIENAVIANVQYQVEILQASPTLTQLIEKNQLKIVGGRYDLDTGKVTML